jgi:KTSC domain
MELVIVESSMIRAVGYDAAAQQLEVLFNSGKTYCYTDVPPTVYTELLTADSKGQYMRACVIGVYPDYELARRRQRKAASK